MRSVKFRVCLSRRSGGSDGEYSVERCPSRIDDTGGDSFDSCSAYGAGRDVLALATGIERICASAASQNHSDSVAPSLKSERCVFFLRSKIGLGPVHYACVRLSRFSWDCTYRENLLAVLDKFSPITLRHLAQDGRITLEISDTIWHAACLM